jgi:hypothetical protein
MDDGRFPDDMNAKLNRRKHKSAGPASSDAAAAASSGARPDEGASYGTAQSVAVAAADAKGKRRKDKSAGALVATADSEMPAAAVVDAREGVAVDPRSLATASCSDSDATGSLSRRRVSSKSCLKPSIGAAIAVDVGTTAAQAPDVVPDASSPLLPAPLVDVLHSRALQNSTFPSKGAFLQIENEILWAAMQHEASNLCGGNIDALASARDSVFSLKMKNMGRC